jgi:hypothetical protein
MSDQKIEPELLSAYLDGELDPAQRRRIEQALADMPKLAQELQGLRALRQALRELPRQQAPSELAGRVLRRAERLHLVKGLPVRSVRVFRWSSALVAAIVLVAAGVGISIIYQLSHVETFDELMASKPVLRPTVPAMPVVVSDEKPGEAMALRSGGEAGETSGMTREPAVEAADRAAPTPAGSKPVMAMGTGSSPALAMATDHPAGRPTGSLLALADAYTQELVVPVKQLELAQSQLEAVLKEEGVRPLVASNDLVVVRTPPAAAAPERRTEQVLGNYIVYGTNTQLTRLRRRVSEVQSRLSPPVQPSAEEIMRRAALESEELDRVVPYKLPSPIAPEQPPGMARLGGGTLAVPAASPATVLGAAPTSSAPANQPSPRPLNQIWSYAPKAFEPPAGAAIQPNVEPMLITLISQAERPQGDSGGRTAGHEVRVEVRGPPAGPAPSSAPAAGE